MQENWQKYLAEAFATFGFVFVGAGAVLANSVSGGLGPVGVALAHGLALMTMIYVTLHLSGAHINPAVTVALWATGHVKTGVALGYVISQLVGATVGALFLKLTFTTASPSLYFGAPLLGLNVTPGTAILVEALLTFLLVWAVFGVIVDKRGDMGHASGLAVGLVLTFAYLVGSALTGAALNPARSFGPALVSSFWTNHYVYWVGPLLGALVAGFVYHFGFLKHRQ